MTERHLGRPSAISREAAIIKAAIWPSAGAQARLAYPGRPLPWPALRRAPGSRTRRRCGTPLGQAGGGRATPIRAARVRVGCWQPPAAMRQSPRSSRRAGDAAAAARSSVGRRFGVASRRPVAGAGRLLADARSAGPAGRAHNRSRAPWPAFAGRSCGARCLRGGRGSASAVCAPRPWAAVFTGGRPGTPPPRSRSGCDRRGTGDGSDAGEALRVAVPARDG
jgi:hypothetical protein